MTKQTETYTHLTQGKNKDFDSLVKKTVEYLKNKATRVIMVNNGGYKCHLNSDSSKREVPLLLEIKQHLNNTATVLFGLEAGDIVAVNTNQTYNADKPVKFFNNVLYLRCETPGSFLEQTFSLEGTQRSNKDTYQSLDVVSSLASITNKLFLKTFIGAALMTDYHHNEMMQIVFVDRMMTNNGSMFNSLVYKVLETETGYKCEPVSLEENFEKDCIHIRHHYSKNEIQFYYTNKDKVHEILTWIESQSNGKFFIHQHTNKIKQDPTIHYRVCPVLFGQK